MFYVHPVVQFLATVLAAYVFWLGWPRLWAAFAGGNAFFSWKRHVRLGLTSLIVLLAGMFGGALYTSHFWGGTGSTGWHYWIALGLTPLMVFGLGSGLILDRQKGRRKVLPIVHGVINLTVLILALAQIWTGFGMVRGFLF